MTPEQHAEAAEQILDSLRPDSRIPPGTGQETTWSLLEALTHAVLSLREAPAAASSETVVGDGGVGLGREDGYPDPGIVNDGPPVLDDEY